MGSINTATMLLPSLIFLLLVNWSSANGEYICNNATVSADLQITLVVNQYFGSSCDTPAPPSSVNPISNNIIEWSKKVLPADLNLGLQIIDACGDVEIATKAITELVPWSSIASDQLDICTVSSSAPATSIGVISAVQLVNYDIANLLSEAELPLIVAKDGYYDGALPNDPSIFYLGNSMDITIVMMSQFMVSLKWDFLTVVYSDDTIGMESYKAFEKMTPKYHLCIDKAIAVDSQLTIPSIDTNGVVYLGSQSIGLQLLTQNDLNNKIWVTSLDVEGLTLGSNGKVYSVIRSGGDVLIDSLAVLGQAIADAYNSQSSCRPGALQACANSEFRSSVISETQKILNENLMYTINADGSVTKAASAANVIYNAFRHTGAKELVATISLSNGVTPQLAFSEEPSLCDPTAMDCMSKCGQLNQEYLYIHGDWITVVSLPIRKEVDPKNRWKCVGFTQTGLFRAEVASYAFKELRKQYPMVEEKTMGLLVIDSCGDKLKTGGLLYNVISGNQMVCDRENNCMDHNAIVAVVGDYSSAVTQQMQTIVKILPAIQIAYGASSVVLNDRTLFPYFLRSNPPDNVQAHFMVELLKKIADEPGNDINAVNIIYTDGLYGRTGAQGVKSALMEAGICVHLESKVNETRANNFTQLVDYILYYTGDVRFIVLFLDPQHLRNLMDAINTPENRNRWIGHGFSLILSDTWNDDPELLDRYGNIAKGSFSFKFNADFESTSLKGALESRMLSTIDDHNPWLSTLEQEYGKCKIRGNFLSQFSTPCVNPSNFVGLSEESYSLHLMKVLTAITLGIRSIAFHYVKEAPNYLFDPDTIDERYDTILRIKIPNVLEGGPNDQEPFTQRTADSDTYGNGRVGYTIYNIDGDPKYSELVQTGKEISDNLGEFNQIAEFYKSDRATKFIESVSELCVPTTTAIPEVITTDSSPPGTAAGLVAATSVIGGLLFLVIVGVGAFFVWKYLKKRNQPRRPVYDEVGNYSDRMSPAQRIGVQQYTMDLQVPSENASYPELPRSEEEEIYKSPKNNTLVRGLDNQAYEVSEGGETVRGSDTTSTTSGTNSAKSPPVPAPRVSSSEESTVALSTIVNV